MAKQRLTVMGYNAFNKLRMRLNREGTEFNINRFEDIYTFVVV